MTDRQLLEVLPVAIYTTDAEGRLTFYNDAAADLWGQRPALGQEWCGSWRLYTSEGAVLPASECPMAVALRTGRPVRGVEAILERPDGTRVPFRPYPTPLHDESGRLTGGINLLVDLRGEHEHDLATAQLAAIVEGSDDAIVSKTLDGIIRSWNAGAERIFGYTAEEMIGQHITRIIPPELHEEEADILSRLRRGERIDHFDTIRVAKDGRRVDISLTVSPLRDKAGVIVGCSKNARDVTERKRAEELQTLLMEELNHRVKNTLATIQALASQSLRRSPNPKDFVASFTGRVQALARAHDLLVAGNMRGSDLAAILREQVLLAGIDPRITYSGPALLLDSRASVHLSLVLHELATNARKYGALSLAQGRLSISWSVTNRELRLIWCESGVSAVTAPAVSGFGTILIERTLQADGGHAAIAYRAGGITCEIRLPIAPTEAEVALKPVAPMLMTADDRVCLTGRRVLLVEDEPLVAMDMEAEMAGLGCTVVGPVATVAAALALIAEEKLDAALVDANLAGHSVEAVTIALAQRGVPFAFATGYGRDALPAAFRDATILSKPFNHPQLIACLEGLLRPIAGVVRLRGGG